MTLMLLENTLAVLSLGKLCEEFGYSYHWTSGQNHISSKMARHFIATIRSSTSSTSPTSSSQESVNDAEIPAIRRSESASEESLAREDPWHRSAEIEPPKKMTTKNYRVMSCKACQIGYRSSSMDWLMKVFQNTEIFPVLLMNYFWSREQKWYRVNTAFFLLTFRKTGIPISV